MDTKHAVPADTIGNRLVLTRVLAGHLSIRQAALRCGIGRGAWQNWERGVTPPMDKVVKIADELGVDFNWLARGGALAGPPTEPGATGDPTITRTTRGLITDSQPSLDLESIAA